MSNALISLKPKHAQNILAGKKTVELRNRAINLLPGTRLWIYTTLPRGCIEMVAIIDKVHFGTPEFIWDKFSSGIGISKEEYDCYVAGRNKVSAITLKSIQQINPGISLKLLKSKVAGFHPPQFLKNLTADNPLLNIFHLLVGKEFNNVTCEMSTVR